MGDPSFFFQERQSITFLSALQLALSAFSAVIIYSIKRIISHKSFSWTDINNIWLIAFFVLGFATADEYFMIHEGIDGDILTWFFGITDNPHLDGLTLGLYGVGAIALFLKYRKELLAYPRALVLFSACGVFFCVSILLDLGSVDKVRIFLEESSKLIAVSFLFTGFLSILWSVLAGIGPEEKTLPN
jgi:hypothetical protein